ncbi:MAG TPA: hypothetical protein PK765_01115 [bacterium]|nr:hypothetical protein [bacterium]
MEITKSIGQILSDLFFESTEVLRCVHNVDIVDVSVVYQKDFANEILPSMLTASPYDESFASALREFKYHGDRSRLGEFASILAMLLERVEPFDLLVVPPYPVWRTLTRAGRRPMRELVIAAGYADNLLSERAFAPVWTRAEQARRSREERLSIFRNPPFHLRLESVVRDRRVVIVDDVVST